MLNRKLIQKGLVSTVLLICIALFATAGSWYATGNMSIGNDTLIQVPKLDTISLELTGVSDDVLAKAPEVPLTKQGQKFVEAYLTRNNELMEKMKDKSPQFFPVMDSIFDSYQLPVELKYLAIVESELRPTIVSHVGARGTWQLMPTTARLLKLKVTKHYDERTNVKKSTAAAAKYLRDLHRQFGDWLLAIAAYNSGPGPILKAIRLSGSRNFWKMQYYLPTETRGHVKRFIATHHYFEGHGGITTMTKEETAKHKKSMVKYFASIDKEVSQHSDTKLAIAVMDSQYSRQVIATDAERR